MPYKIPFPSPVQLRIALEEVASRIPRTLITRAKGQPYLHRAYLSPKVPGDLKDLGPNLFLHTFVADDDEGQLHCHPWEWSVSYILVGSYREVRSTPKRRDEKLVVLKKPTVKLFKPGMINVIKSDTFHNVSLVTKDVWTLFLHGPRTTEWAFVKMVYGEPTMISMVSGRTRDGTTRVIK